MQKQEARKISTINVKLPVSVKSEVQTIATMRGLSLTRLVRELMTRVAAYDPVTLAWIKEAGSSQGLHI